MKSISYSIKNTKSTLWKFPFVNAVGEISSGKIYLNRSSFSRQ